MHIEPAIAAVGLGVGAVVGLTGMGGGALMTPLLVLLFGIPPTAAVASDLAASVFMKPLGAFVHARRGTVDRRLVQTLILGSIPAAFAGAALVNLAGDPESVGAILKPGLGAALLVAAAAMVAKATIRARREEADSEGPIHVHWAPTVLIGVVGGAIVGMTSVGSGSLMMVLLMLLYPRLGGARLVGTDLAQAVPLVMAATAGHLLFGSVELGLTTSLLVGALPGVYIGARLSSAARDQLIRPVLVTVLCASALKLLEVPTGTVVACAGLGLIAFGSLAVLRRPAEI